MKSGWFTTIAATSIISSMAASAARPVIAQAISSLKIPNSPTGSSNATVIPNPVLFDTIANYEQWMRIFACQHTVGNWDSYGYNRGKNDYTYKGQNGRFEQMTWDIDFTMGVGGGDASQDLINPSANPISDPRVVGMFKTPVILRAYWRALQDIINGPLNNSFLDPILDA